MAIALVAGLALTGCIKETSHYASDKMVRDVAYVHDGPPRISLYTMVNNDSGAGAHSALVINASQRVILTLRVLLNTTFSSKKMTCCTVQRQACCSFTPARMHAKPTMF